jgi:hypothetical protein
VGRRWGRSPPRAPKKIEAEGPKREKTGKRIKGKKKGKEESRKRARKGEKGKRSKKQDANLLSIFPSC